MSSIVGLQGNFKGNKIIEMLKASKNRGLDASGIFLDNIELNIDLDNFHDDNIYSFGLGHNFLDVSNLKSNYQPVSNGKLILVLDGEIYNFKTLKNFLAKISPSIEINSSSEAILILINYFNKKSLVEAIQSTIPLIEGDYSFAVWDGENLAIVRDAVGVKPLFYSVTDDLNAFASSKQSLKILGFNEILTLKPNHILYNWEEIEPAEKLTAKKQESDSSKLEKLLKKSVLQRVGDLDEIAVVFSGGVDSSLLTLILNEISENKNLKIKLYAVGDKNSKDVKAAKLVANKLNLPLKIHDVTLEIVEENLESVVKAIGDTNLMKIGVGMTIYLACNMIKEDGIKVAISGQGADELFGGYNRYLESYKNNTLDKDLRYDIENMYHVNLERDDACSMINGVELRLPFLDKKFVQYCVNLPVKYKISGSDDLLRKNILRKLALKLGLNHEIVYRPKKAAQYGTGIDKILRKKILPKLDFDSLLD